MDQPFPALWRGASSLLRGGYGLVRLIFLVGVKWSSLRTNKRDSSPFQEGGGKGFPGPTLPPGRPELVDGLCAGVNPHPPQPYPDEYSS